MTDSGVISDDLLRALGRMTIDYGTLEFASGVALWILLQSDSLVTAQTITAELSFRARLDLIGSLAMQKIGAKEELLSRIKAAVKSATAAVEARNSIVHAHLAVLSDGSLVRVKYTAKGKTGFQTSEKPISVESLSKVVADLGTATTEWAKIDRDLLARFPIRGGTLQIDMPT